MLNNLAMLYESMGRRQEAKTSLERAVEILRRSLGDDHPKTAVCCLNLVRLAKDPANLPR